MSDIDRLIDKVANDLAAALKLVKQVKFNGNRKTRGNKGNIIDIDIYQQTIRNANALYRACLQASRYQDDGTAIKVLETAFSKIADSAEKVESKIAQFDSNVPDVITNNPLSSRNNPSEADTSDAGSDEDIDEEEYEEEEADAGEISASEKPESKGYSPHKPKGYPPQRVSTLEDVLSNNSNLANSGDLELPAPTLKSAEAKDQEGQNGAASAVGNSSSGNASNQGNVSSIPPDVLKVFKDTAAN